MTTYIGYDLGDGDTCISIYEMQNGKMTIGQAVMPGMDPGAAMPTLLAMDETGRGWVGPVTLRDKLIAQTAELDINFKMRPTELSDDEFSAFKRKVKCFTETLFKTCPTIQNLFGDFTRKRFVVAIGHPTTWSFEDTGLYKSIFEEAECFARPGEFFDREDDFDVELMVAPESHAALMNLINAKSASPGAGGSSCDITVDDIPPGGYAVVFDFGSSTADTTIIRNNGGHIETGEDVRGDAHLGARYIDRAVYRTIRDEKLSGEVRDRLLAALQLPGNKNLERQLIYFCREAKENFFLTEAQDRQNNMFHPLRHTPGNFFQLDDEFTADGCGIMEKAVDEPIPELGGKSWKESCREMFATVKTRLDAQASAPALVFLTGGASRMDFVQAFAEETFPDVRILVDSHPSHCISHGLAYLPHRLEVAGAFLDEVRNYITVVLPGKIAAQTDSVARAIADGMADRICAVALEEAQRWKRCKYDTLNEMQGKINEAVKKFVSSSDAGKISGAAVSAMLTQRLVPSVKKDLETLCKKHGDIPFAGYELADPLTDWAKEFSAYVNGQTAGAGIARGIGTDVVSSVIKIVGLAVAAILAPIVLLISTGIVVPIVTWLSVTIFSILIESGVGIPIALTILGVGLVYVIAHGGWEAAKQQFVEKVKGVDLPQWVRNRISDDSLKNKVDDQHDAARLKISSSLSQSPSFKVGLQNSLAKPISERFMMMAEDLALRIRN